jgi:hypothetical protein
MLSLHPAADGFAEKPGAAPAMNISVGDPIGSSTRGSISPRSFPIALAQPANAGTHNGPHRLMTQGKTFRAGLFEMPTLVEIDEGRLDRSGHELGSVV